MIRLLSGNEAIALGAYHAGVKVAAAYPGTPSTEILESIARLPGVKAEWSPNEKVAMEVAMGASYAGVRTLVSMKQVGLNVAADPFMAIAVTGVNAGLVLVSADDPGIHSSQCEQDNRHYASFAKVPMLEPSDSQEAYDLMSQAFNISEKYDTPVMFRTTTRISHSKSVVEARSEAESLSAMGFQYNAAKLIMLPVYARLRQPILYERIARLSELAETISCNRVFAGSKELGIITGGVAYQYAREIFPDASYLKLGMAYPLPENLIRRFARSVRRLFVIEELDSFIQDNIKMMGIKVEGKEFIPRSGELNPDIVEEAGKKAGLLPEGEKKVFSMPELPKRPPLLCAGCPHTGIFFTLSSMGQRARQKQKIESKLIITGDIGCYTLAAFPPLKAMDTTACMGASIGQAIGIDKAAVKQRVVAVIGDSTFLHSGITGLLDAVYNKARITVVILDNRTTAMTGHQEHPGTGKTAQGEETVAVDLEQLVKGVGVTDVRTVDAFNLKALRSTIKAAVEGLGVSVIIVRGECPTRVSRKGVAPVVDAGKCDDCGSCLLLGCPAIQKRNGKAYIEPSLCTGEYCGLCRQLCPHQAIQTKSL